MTSTNRPQPREQKKEKNPKNEQLIELLRNMSAYPPPSDAELIASFQPGAIKLSDPISAHVAWAARVFYRKQLKEDRRTEDEKKSDIFRLHHGITHVGRTAGYISAIINLHRRYDDEDYASFTDEDIKYLQIAAVFHDVARLNEGRDLWDADSGLILYFILTRVLEVNHEKAKLLAEAIANKDNRPRPYANYYKELIVGENGKVSWQIKKGFQKNPYIEPLREADMFDVKRARAHFIGRRTDFYKKFINKKSPKYHPNALREFSRFRLNIQSLIERQGDGYRRQDLALKKRYELAESPYDTIVADFAGCDFLSAMYNNNKLIKDVAVLKKPLPPEKDHGYIRCISAPSQRVPKPRKKSTETPQGGNLEEKEVYETNVEKEYRKVGRVLGVPTETRKPNRTQKHGSQKRSISRAGFGSGMFSNSGVRFKKLNVARVRAVSATDFGTGHGKKKELKLADYTAEEKSAQLANLDETLQAGGSSTPFSYASTNTEIVYDIEPEKQADGRGYTHPFQDAEIVFTPDPNIYNFYEYQSGKPVHTNAPILEAIMEQKQLIKMTKMKLPIYEYSGLYDIDEERKEFDSDNIEGMKKLWVDMCSDYMEKELAKNMPDIMRISIDDIKVKSMYKKMIYHLPTVSLLEPADICFEPEVRAAITEAIRVRRDELWKKNEDESRKLFRESKKSILADDHLFFAILNHPQLLAEANVQDKVLLDLQQYQSKLNWKSNKLTSFRGKDAKEFFSNKENFLKSSEIIYYSDFVKYFALLKLLKQTKPSDQVNQLFDEFIKKITIEFQATIARAKAGFDQVTAASIIDLMNLIICFDLDSAAFRKEIAELGLNTLKKQIATPYRSSYGSSDFPFMDLAEALDMYHFIDDATKKELALKAKAPLNPDRMAHSVYQLSCLREHLKLIWIAGIPIDEKKDDLITLLQRKDIIDLADLVNNVANLEPNIFDDKNVFQAIVNCPIVAGDQLFLTINNCLSRLNFLDHNLKGVFPTQQYAPWQKEMVDQAKENIHKELKILVQKFQNLVADPHTDPKAIEYENYLRAAKVIKLSLAEQQKTLSLMINNFGDAIDTFYSRSKFSIPDMLNMVASAPPSTFDDGELFQHFIELLFKKSGYEDTGSKKDRYDDYEFSQNLVALEELMPDEEFSPMQLEHILALQAKGPALREQVREAARTEELRLAFIQAFESKDLDQMRTVLEAKQYQPEWSQAVFLKLLEDQKSTPFNVQCFDLLWSNERNKTLHDEVVAKVVDMQAISKNQARWQLQWLVEHDAPLSKPQWDKVKDTDLISIAQQPEKLPHVVDFLSFKEMRLYDLKFLDKVIKQKPELLKKVEKLPMPVKSRFHSDAEEAKTLDSTILIEAFNISNYIGHKNYVIHLLLQNNASIFGIEKNAEYMDRLFSDPIGRERLEEKDFAKGVLQKAIAADDMVIVKNLLGHGIAIAEEVVSNVNNYSVEYLKIYNQYHQVMSQNLNQYLKEAKQAQVPKDADAELTAKLEAKQILSTLLQATKEPAIKQKIPLLTRSLDRNLQDAYIAIAKEISDYTDYVLDQPIKDQYYTRLMYIRDHIYLPLMKANLQNIAHPKTAYRTP